MKKKEIKSEIPCNINNIKPATLQADYLSILQQVRVFMTIFRNYHF